MELPIVADAIDHEASLLIRSILSNQLKYLGINSPMFLLNVTNTMGEKKASKFHLLRQL